MSPHIPRSWHTSDHPLEGAPTAAVEAVLCVPGRTRAGVVGGAALPALWAQLLLEIWRVSLTNFPPFPPAPLQV